MDITTGHAYPDVYDFGNVAQNVHVIFENVAGAGLPITGVMIEVYTFLDNYHLAPAMVAAFTFDADQRVDVPLPTNTLGAPWMYIRQVPPTAPGANDPVMFQILYEGSNSISHGKTVR
jgi:hypothetical protein